jgi:hypothetical protein
MGRRTLVVEELELPFPPFDRAAAPAAPAVPTAAARPGEQSPFSNFDCCPMCGGELAPEHAHFRCGSCGWRDSCCD